MQFNVLELFTGAGGLALGFEMAGFHHTALIENNKQACNTLRHNRPNWNIVEEDVKNINFNIFKNDNIDLICGGVPCQAFSHAGKRLGLEDTRGTLFYDFARSVQLLKPKLFLIENVKGLLTHDNGNTIETIKDIFNSIDYTIQNILLLNANNFNVPQIRERVFIIGCPKDSNIIINLPIPSQKKINLKDVLFGGGLYNNDVVPGIGSTYSILKQNLFKKIPPGGNWKNLTIEEQKNYLGKMFESGGGKTGILKRLSFEQPSPTLLCSPTQKQTERCHPIENRPLTINEYARIQTFPDNWKFCGSINNQYKQIGNAVPVNLAFSVAKALFDTLKNHEQTK